MTSNVKLAGSIERVGGIYLLYILYNGKSRVMGGANRLDLLEAAIKTALYYDTHPDYTPSI